ncbi:hypothetical protein GQ457_08G018530 [Hibiscus cannabinus]
MAPDSLLHQFDDLKFTVEEQDVFVNATTVAIPEDDPRLSLVGCVIMSHALDGATLIRIFRAAWKPTKVISITELRSNFFMIRLTSEEVRTNILKRGPWVFNDDWFAILPFNPMLSIDEYFFTKMIFWVHILRIPIGLMSESLCRSLGACIGSVVGTDTRIIDGNMGDFLRVRVSIDVSKPLRRCVALGGCGSKPRLCPLQYEKLPSFCHGCGFVSHLVVDCPRQPYDPLIKFQYGDWLRVDMKARHVVPFQQKGRIHFHEKAGSSNSHSGFSSLGTSAGVDVSSRHAPFAAATPLRSIPVPASVASLLGVATTTSLNAEEGVAVSTEATVGVDGSHDVLAVDCSGKVRIMDNILFGYERDVFVTRVSHEADAPVVVALAFDAIEEWLAEDNDSDVQVPVDLPVKIPEKRSSGGSDPSKAKRTRSITMSSVPKESRVLKAGMRISKISLAAVDKQPRRGNENIMLELSRLGPD